MKEVKFEPIVHFDRKCKCDFCGCTEICGITHYGTTHYNRVICVECCMSINQQEKPFGRTPFDLNNSTIVFGDNLVYDCTKDDENL